jgi:hypothetical protein
MPDMEEKMRKFAATQGARDTRPPA